LVIADTELNSCIASSVYIKNFILNPQYLLELYGYKNVRNY